MCFGGRIAEDVPGPVLEDYVIPLSLDQDQPEIHCSQLHDVCEDTATKVSSGYVLYTTPIAAG